MTAVAAIYAFLTALGVTVVTLGLDAGMDRGGLLLVALLTAWCLFMAGHAALSALTTRRRV